MKKNDSRAQKFITPFFLNSPWRIVDDCGGAFTMGVMGGGLFQAVKGFRNAPSVSVIWNIFLS